MKKDNDKVDKVEKKEATDQPQDQQGAQGDQEAQEQATSSITGMNIDLAKLREVMVWDKYKGEKIGRAHV